MGGRLIRETIGFLRSQNVDLPISSYILTGVSGGIDSLALAHLLIHYGRRIAPTTQIQLLHIQHGWRGEASEADARFVLARAKAWGVGCKVVRVRPPTTELKESWEDFARKQRKAVFAREAERLKAIVMTAHQGDDLAETLLWRLFTGAAQTHGGGIAVRHGSELRPFLRFRKAQLQAYLLEEGEKWQEDETNSDARFLRSRMRMGLMPTIEELFPKAIDHLIEAGLNAQNVAGKFDTSAVDASKLPGVVSAMLFQAAGIQTRRTHRKLLDRIAESRDESGSSSTREMHLPGGWRLVRYRKSKKTAERWVLEKSQET